MRVDNSRGRSLEVRTRVLFPILQIEESINRIRKTRVFRDLDSHSSKHQILIYFSLLFFSISNVTTYSQGFGFSAQNLYWFPLQIFAIFLLLGILPKNVSGPIDVLQIFSALFLTIPTIVISFSNESQVEIIYTVQALCYCLLFQISISLLARRFGGFRIQSSPLSLKIWQIYLILIFLILSFVFVICFSVNPNWKLVALNDVYEGRQELASAIRDSKKFLLPYFVSLIGGILIPTVLILSMVLRKKRIIFFSIFLSFAVYMITLEKWILASVFLVSFLFLIARENNNASISGARIFLYFNVLISGALITQALFTFIPWADLVIRRSLLDPAIMLQYYVKYTSFYPHQWWADSKLRSVFLESDTDSVAKIIGDRFFNNPAIHIYPDSFQTNATGGALADSIAQGGFLGFMCITFLVFFFFWLLQIFTFGRNFFIIFVLSAIAVELLVEGTLHTLMLSRGLVLLPLIFCLLPLEASMEADKPKMN